ncbi:hypothetical protein BJ986_002806 [Phycicoccus badiiscoriae]|uniref:DUF5655 domain-containing protein n=1 Tax=Pedococcus badiiscoriae TaxID=642776 RepID=A0A852WHR7_9MICO|nr:DUF5655 domain-containing protein [Pedococcus badiiscoriae]NYG08319.1 hypothetical protein [Pedococcus badiiscoriae]
MEPADMMAAVTTSMAERTGRGLDEWVALVRESGPDPLDQRAVRAWLKDVHGVPQNSQWAIADAAATGAGWQRPDVDAYTDALYSGSKAHLRPIHDAVMTLAEALGDDARREGRGTYIPVIRKTQFVAVAPGPRGTVRVGFRFRGPAPEDERLSPAKGFAQATHWLHLAADADEDDLRSLEPLLETAYRQNG